MILAQRPPKFWLRRPTENLWGLGSDRRRPTRRAAGWGVFSCSKYGGSPLVHQHVHPRIRCQATKVGFQFTEILGLKRQGNSIAQVGNGFYRCRRCPICQMGSASCHVGPILRDDPHAPQGSAWRLWRRCFC